MKVKRHAATNPLTLFPASLLKDGRRRRQMTANRAPCRYVLVSQRNNPKQTRLMRKLGHSLQARGIRVSMLSL